MITYRKARADFEFLETIAELDDQVELDSRRLELMKQPTKAKARDMYISAILLWLNEHGQRHDMYIKRVTRIKETYS